MYVRRRMEIFLKEKVHFHSIIKMVKFLPRKIIKFIILVDQKEDVKAQQKTQGGLLRMVGSGGLNWKKV